MAGRRPRFPGAAGEEEGRQEEETSGDTETRGREDAGK
jgi:hypothetical protein